MAISTEAQASGRTTAPDELLSARLWSAGREPVPLDPSSTDFGEGIAWFDLRSGGDAARLFGYLEPRCQGLTLEMLSDLLEPDRRPQGEEWDDGAVRLASTFAVYPTETKNGRDDWSCAV